MKVNAEGYALIKRFEGCRLKAYKCPANVWTIGFGNTFYENAKLLIQWRRTFNKERFSEIFFWNFHNAKT